MHTSNSHHHWNVNWSKIFICFTKVKTNFFSATPVLSLIPWVGYSPYTKRFFFLFSVWHDGLLLTSKVRTFLSYYEDSMNRLHQMLFLNHCKQIYFLLCFLLIWLYQINKFLEQNYWQDYVARYLIHRLCISYYTMKKNVFCPKTELLNFKFTLPLAKLDNVGSRLVSNI